MRLSRYLAHSGIASRRGAEELIRAGRVTVGGEVVTDPARDVDASSGVVFDGVPVRELEDTVVIAVHKPKGVVSTARDTHGRPTVVDLVGARRRLYPVGRLDADTTGLILLTDDGELANRLTHPRYGVPKTYRAVVAHAPVREEALERLRAGVQLEDGKTRPAEAKRLAPDKVELTIREGRKRQVRRMLEEGAGELPPSARKKLVEFVKLLDSFRELAKRSHVSEVYHHILEATGYVMELKAENSDEAKGRIQKVALARRVTLTLSAAPQVGAVLARLRQLAPSATRFAFRIGERNSRVTLDYLSRQGYSVRRTDVGGNINRTLHLEVNTGAVTLKTPTENLQHSLAA